jgi:hypothetical protein
MNRDEHFRLLITQGTTEKDIADALLSGNVSQGFLRVLAWSLCPPEHKKPLYRLKLSYRDIRRPRGTKTYNEAKLVEELLALEGLNLPRGKAKPQRQDILDRHGVSARTATAALKHHRELQELVEWHEAIKRSILPSSSKPEKDGADK